jgi:hypothetical protein
MYNMMQVASKSCPGNGKFQVRGDVLPARFRVCHSIMTSSPDHAVQLHAIDDMAEFDEMLPA